MRRQLRSGGHPPRAPCQITDNRDNRHALRSHRVCRGPSESRPNDKHPRRAVKQACHLQCVLRDFTEPKRCRSFVEPRAGAASGARSLTI